MQCYVLKSAGLSPFRYSWMNFFFEIHTLSQGNTGVDAHPARVARSPALGVYLAYTQVVNWPK